MRTKAVTSVLLVIGLAMLLAMPWYLAQRPTRSSPVQVRRQYARTLLYYWAGMLGCLVGAGAGSLLIVRDAKRQFRREYMNNMKLLVEGSLQDQKKADGADGDTA